MAKKRPDLDQPELPLQIDSPLLSRAKNERVLMVWNFFSLSKDRITSLPVYDDGRVRIEVKGTNEGVATIWDKELLIYLASLMQDKLNRGEPVSNKLTFIAHDFFRVVGTKPVGRAYDRIEAGLRRLQGTQIITNIETGGVGEDAAFSWIDRYRILYRRTEAGDKEMQAIEVQICDWLLRALLKDARILTYDHRYFDLAPLERRLYEIARAHCGRQAGFTMGLGKLRKRVGSDSPLKLFKSRLVKMQGEDGPLPEYLLTVFDPRRPLGPKGATDPTKPPPKGRTPLERWMVFFQRRDVVRLPFAPSNAPEADDLPEHGL
jgi:plasmid replication initiation protein